MGLDGVDHSVGGDQDRAMLGGRIVVDGEEQVVAGLEGIECQGDHVTAGGIGECFLTQSLGAVAGKAGSVFGIAAIDPAPDPAYETEAIAAHAFERRLMVVGRADPRARLGDGGLSNRYMFACVVREVAASTIIRSATC
jgi:hypothetical protein